MEPAVRVKLAGVFSQLTSPDDWKTWFAASNRGKRPLLRLLPAPQQAESLAVAGNAGNRSILEFGVTWRPWVRDHVADVFHPRDVHQQPLEPDTITGVLGFPVLPQVEVPLILFLR